MPVVYEATCEECGEELEVTAVSLDSGDDLCINIAPCRTCIEEEVNEAISTSFDAGKEEGCAEGHLKGYAQCEKDNDL